MLTRTEFGFMDDFVARKNHCVSFYDTYGDFLFTLYVTKRKIEWGDGAVGLSPSEMRDAR